MAKAINSDITKAHTLEGRFYTSQWYFETSLEKIFSRSWQYVTDDKKLSKTGDAYPFNFLGESIQEPLVLIKTKESIRCLSNVCTHRGNILITEPCNIKKSITCGYHGRKFNTCGKFKFMPSTQGMKNFPSEKDNLTNINLARWRQFLFTSLNPHNKLEELIKDVEERVGWMPIEEFKYNEKLSKQYHVKANWALYCDNYLEGFHIPFIHSGLNSVLDFKNYDVEVFKYSNLQIGIASDEEICFDLPKKSKDYGKKIAAYYFWLFPNLMLNFYPWGLSINIVTPINVNETRVDFKSYVWDESKLINGAGADLHKVELEDEQVVQQVQKGVGSRFYKHGRFSPKMEKGVHHFHTLIGRSMNFK